VTQAANTKIEYTDGRLSASALRARRMISERTHFLPSFSSIATMKKRARIGANASHSRLVGVDAVQIQALLTAV
jgi:hypothetical protein